MALTWKKLKYDEVSASSRILGRKTAGAGAIEELTLSEIMDFIGSAAEGDILYRGASAWARLGKGSDGQVLTLASGLPSWAAAGGGATINHVKKTSDFSTTSSSYVSVTNFSLSVEASKTYLVMYDIKIRKTDAAESAYIQFSIPADATINGSSWSIVAGALSQIPYFENASGGDKDLLGVYMNSLAVGLIRGMFIIVTTSSGTLSFKIKNIDGTISLHTGSFITAVEVS